MSHVQNARRYELHTDMAAEKSHKKSTNISYFFKLNVPVMFSLLNMSPKSQNPQLYTLHCFTDLERARI